METLQKRLLLFLIGCIGARLFLVYLAKTLDPEKLKYLGYITLLPAIGFTYIYLTNSRKTGPEVFGEEIWWNNLRPVHALLYFLFAYCAINNVEGAWKILLVDVVIGLVAFLNHRVNSS